MGGDFSITAPISVRQRGAEAPRYGTALSCHAERDVPVPEDPFCDAATRGQGGPDGADLERRDTRAHQNEPAGVSNGGAEEYTMSNRHTPTMNSRLTGVAANPRRRRSVRPAPEGPFCHAAKREAASGLPCTRVDSVVKKGERRGS